MMVGLPGIAIFVSWKAECAMLFGDGLVGRDILDLITVASAEA